MPFIASGFLPLLSQMAFATLLLTGAPLLGQGNSPANQNANDVFPDLKIPAKASVEQLQAIVAKAKRIRPSSPQQYQAMQTAIRDASKKLVEKLKADPDSDIYRQAELDAISASVSLMTFFGPDAQKKTLEQIHEFLKNRKKLSLEDVQTGMMAAAMLELQPNKRPARSTYELLHTLLEDDEREEMQSLRVNLDANIRRLGLLGKPLELKAKTMDGKKLEIKDFAGNFVLVSFFTTWCKPYLDEIPRLKSHHAKYREKGLEIVAISLDQDKADLEKHVKTSELPWPVIHDAVENPLDSLQIQFGISQLPTVFLLNKEGTVVSLEARGAELDRLMQMLFDAPTPAPQKAPASKGTGTETKPEKKTSSIKTP